MYKGKMEISVFPVFIFINSLNGTVPLCSVSFVDKIKVIHSWTNKILQIV